MIYAKIKPGVWVKYEDAAESGTILFKRKLVERRKEINIRLGDLPVSPSNATLLAWARENYPMMNYGPEREALAKELDAIENDLNNMVDS